MRRSRLPSPVWLVPLVAAAIAAWVAWDSLAGRGPRVEVFFASAEGLEAEKTRIKLKEVDVGVVESVGLTPDLARIRVSARLDPGMATHLTESTRFWIVRPRVGVGGVTGLGTLLSGAYLEMDAGDGSGEARSSFEGVEDPPLIRSTAPGRRFELRSDGPGGVARGSPVTFRGVEVGQVLGQELAEGGRGVVVQIFVRSPHDALVREATRFWAAGGIRARAGAGGVELEVAPLQSLLQGGVAFDTPEAERDAPAAEPGRTFRLHASRDASERPDDAGEVRPFLVFFDGSVRGLNPEAPVEFRGIRVGAVRSVRLDVDAASAALRIPVVLELEPWRWLGPDAFAGEEGEEARRRRQEAGTAAIADLVRRGLRARLESGNIVTGELYVSLDLYPSAPPAALETTPEGVPILPSVPSQLQELTTSLSGAVQRFAALPIEPLLEDVRDALGSIEGLATGPATAGALDALRRSLERVDALTADLARDVPQAAASLRGTTDAATLTLRELRATAQAVNGIVGENSRLRYDLTQALRQLGEAARSVGELADTLERHPDSLLRGRQVDR